MGRVTVYRIKSAALKARGDKIEGIDKRRMEKRLAEVQRAHDPQARLLTIPGTR